MYKKYDFDTVIERRGSNCIKYDFNKEFGKPEDLLALWVADMDFQAAPAIRNRLQKVLDHGVFGYSDVKEDYYQAMANWYRTRFDWEIKKDWVLFTPGVVFALAAAVRVYTKPGDKILIQQPVYHPFKRVIEQNDRVMVNSPLKLVNGHYEIDFEDFERKIAEEQVRLYFLCSPHNPVSRVWTEAELNKIGEICVKYGVIVVSDEIHSDFVYPDYKHHMFASLSPDFAAISMTCTAPSKTFNLAGLQTSNIIISNPQLREKFRQELERISYQGLNLMGMTACQAAYEEAGEWLDALKEYLTENLNYVRSFLQKQLPQIKLIEPEGTYLIWLDFRELGLSEEAREDLIINKAGLWFDSGAMFGKNGEGFERVNLACPRITLEEAMTRLKKAVDSI